MLDAIFYLRLVGLILSFVGFKRLVEDKLDIKSNYSWLFIFSSISCLIYFAGFIGKLWFASYLLFTIGLVLFIFYLFKQKLTFFLLIQKVNLLNISFFIALIILFFSLIPTKFIHYDNFSHWGIIVKYLLTTDAMPTVATDIIDFKTYPLGSTSFIYYICRIVGYSQGLMLFAQSLLILSSFYALFGVIRDIRRYLLISVMGLSFSLMTIFNISIRINNLLVDFLLPLLSLAIIAIIYSYRDRILKACFIVLPILSLLTIVKNSGLFFYAICIFYLLFYIFHSFSKKNIKHNIKYASIGFLTIVTSMLPYIIWNLHTKIALQGTNSKHTLSVENFKEVSSEKSQETVQLIVSKFFNAILSIDSLSTRGLLIFHIITFISYFVAFFILKKHWNSLKILLLLDLIVVLYYAGNLAMFIYTMPTEEAIVLAGLERYLSSMVIFFIGIVSFNLVINIEQSLHIQQGPKRDYKAFKSIQTKRIYQNSALVCTALTLSFLFSEINGMNSMNQSYADTLPGKVTAAVGDQMQLDTQNKFLVYAEDTDNQLSNFSLQYAVKYFLFSPNVDGISTFALEDKSTLDNYDYLLILDDNSVLDGLKLTSEKDLTSSKLYKIDHQQLLEIDPATLSE